MPTSEARRFLNKELMPRWAKQFGPGQVVYDIGVSKWDYCRHFNCQYFTVDRDEKRHPDLVSNIGEYKWTGLPHQADGVVLNGVFEQADDPFSLMRDIATHVLKQNGKILVGLIGKRAPWTSDRDKWRVTKAGARAYCKGFHIDEFYQFRGYFYVLGTKE